MPVYQYEGVHYELPDGLTNEQAVSKIKEHLGQGTKQASEDVRSKFQTEMADVKQSGEDWLKNLRGVAETGLSLATGAAGGVLGIPVGAIQNVRNMAEGNPSDFLKEYGGAMERMTYEPTEELGKELTSKAGDIMNRYVIPSAAVFESIPMAGPAIGGAARVLGRGIGTAGRLLEGKPKAPTEAPKTGAQALVAELKGEVPAAVETAPSAFPEMAGQLTQGQHTPYDAQRIARQQEGVGLESTATALSDIGAQERLAKIQQELDARQADLELAVKRQQTLDANASERVRQEAASAVSDAHRAYEQAQKEARDSELAQRSQQGVQEEMFGNPELFDLTAEGQLPAKATPEMPTKQTELFEPQTNMHRDFTDLRVADGKGGERPLNPREFQTVLENLSKEEGTRFSMPENMQEAYQNYLNSVSDKQGGLFDIGSRQEAFAQNVFRDQLPSRVEAHPAVRNARIKFEKQERFVRDLKEQVRNGETRPTALVGEMKALQEAQIKLEKARQNVTTNLSKSSKLFGENGIAKMNAMMPDDFLAKFPKFGNSTLKGPDGKLRVMYHGTSKDKHFDDIKAGPRGAWLSGVPEDASAYAKQNDSQKLVYEHGKYKEVNTASRVLPVYVNLERPYVLTEADKAAYQKARSYASFQKDITARVKREGYNGIDWGGDVYTVFDKDQMKSAIAPQTKTPKVVEMNAGLRPQLPWKDKGALEVLKGIPGVGDTLKNVGHSMIKNADEAIALAKEAPDVSQNKFSSATNILTKGGTYLKNKVDNPVVHFTVDTMLDSHNQAKAIVNEKLHGEYLTSLRRLSKDEFREAFELLDTADMTKTPLTPELMSKHGISENVQMAVLTHQKLMADALQGINQARAAAGLKPIQARVAYSAMNMSGDFRKVVTKDGQVVGVIGANSKTMGKHSLAKLEAQLKEKDPSLEFGPLQDLSKGRTSTRGTPHEAFTDVLQILGEDNPNIAQFLDTLKEVAKSDPYNYMGMQKHTMNKKGVWGMEGRKPWLSGDENAKAFFENQMAYLENALTWGKLSEGALEVNKVLRDEAVIAKQDKAIRLSEDYLQNSLGINPSKWGKAAESFWGQAMSSMGVGPSVPRNIVSYARMGVNTMLLSVNPAFLGIQLVQAPTVMPGIAAFLRGRGVAPASTWATQGLSHFADAGMTLMKEKLGMKLSDVERGAFDYAKKHHVYATDMVEHANQVRKDVGYYTTKITQSPAAVVEQATRAQVYFAIMKMMDESGLTPKEGLYEQAHRFTDMAMANYSAIEKPKLYSALGPLGSMAYNLRTFSHNEISRWSLYARELARTGNPAPLLTQMATTIAIAGVMGLPFFSQWEQLYDYITGTLMKKPRSLALDVMSMSENMLKQFGPQAMYALSNGLPAILGADTSKRFGLGDVIPEKLSDAIMPGASKLLGIGGAAIEAAKNPSEATAKALAYQAMPSGFQGLADTSWYQKGNITYSKDPTNVKPTGERNELDTSLRKWGLMGIQESVGKTKEFQNRQIDMMLGEFRKKGLNEIKQAIIDGKDIPVTAMKNYFEYGEGDPQSFGTVLERLAIEMNLPPAQYQQMKMSASKSYTQMMALQRRIQ